MIYLGNCFLIVPTLERVGAVVTDPPKKVWIDPDRKFFLHVTSWLADMRAKADTVLFTLSQELSPDLFGTPDKVIKWHWGAQLNLIPVWGYADLPDEITEPWPDPNAFDHGSCKPLPLMKTLVAGTKGTVCDPFMGTGTTGVACKELGRRFIGIESDPRHFKTAEMRLT